MNLTNATCQTLTTLRPKVADLREIRACQAAANSSFCYPPNGTRLCVPITNVPIYWPPRYYHSDSEIALDYDAEDDWVFFRNNTGNRTQDFTPWMFNLYANETGTPNERSINIYIQERRFGEDAEPFNLETHDGPEFILVKTAEFPSTTRSGSSFPTSTSPSPYRGSVNSNRALSTGQIAGIVIGALCTFILLLSCCCCRCCGIGAGKRKPCRQVPDQINRATTVPTMPRQETQARDTSGAPTRSDVEAGNGTAYSVQQEHAQQGAQHARDERDRLPAYSKDEPPPYQP